VTESTDRVLASIGEAIDGYVSEDWAASGDAMRWQPEEPEQGGPWIAPEVWDQTVRVDVGASVVDWFSGHLGRRARRRAHWDGGLSASLDRTRERPPDRYTIRAERAAVARAAEVVGEALRSQPDPEREPLAVNWNVDPGHVPGKRQNRR